jgi:NAD(P)-dependent dehydrogenase (short-subunit alcohol dehydrogenase family)
VSAVTEFDGAVALVTGAAQGLGLATAARLAKGGARVVIGDRQEAAAAAAATRLCATGATATHAYLDVTSSESIEEVLKSCVAQHGSVDIVVNSAGTAQDLAPIAELDEREWARTLAVNLTGTFLVCRAAANVMSKQGSGTIVNFASVNGENPAPLAGAYNVSKAGVIALTKTLALELAASGIRVNAVSPGPVGTEFNKSVMAQRAAVNQVSSEEMIDRITASIPLGRWGQPEEIADAVAFLCSQRASWITGEVIRVSGGLTGVSSPPRRISR